MSAYALISGTIFRAPIQKTAKSGKPFTTCTVKVGSDDSGASDFWNVLIFSESAQLELLRLQAGDAVSIRGKLEIKTYTANDGTMKVGRSIFADAALGLRPVPRERKPGATKPALQESTTTTNAMPAKETAPGGPAFFDDDIPFRPEVR